MSNLQQVIPVQFSAFFSLVHACSMAKCWNYMLTLSFGTEIQMTFGFDEYKLPHIFS